MKTRALLLALPLAALAACRDNRASVQIQEICSATDDCTFGDKCDFSTPEPIFDPSVADRLTLPLQVENQLVDNTNLGLGKTNTNDAHVDEVAVEYTGAFSGRVVLEANGRRSPPAARSSSSRTSSPPCPRPQSLRPGPAFGSRSSPR